MSSTEAFAAKQPCARMPALRVAFCVSLLSLAASDAVAATLGKTYFFATRDACAASGIFSPHECAMAFSNARAQVRDRAPRFAGGAECRLHFHICQIGRTEDAGGAGGALSYAEAEEPVYVPTALGVEMVASANGVEAAPTLAVETPTRLFPYYPVSRVYEPEPQGQSVQAKGEQQNAAILAPDHFEPFSKRKPFAGATTFTASALGAIEGATGNLNGESREDRRMRLRNAPFVE